MDTSISEGVEDDAGSVGFDFSHAEELITDTTEANGDEAKVVEGDVETSEEVAKMQARSVVGMLDISFTTFGADRYGDDVYSDGERHLAPAIVRLNVRLPVFEYINAVLWMGSRLVKSLKEIKRNGEDDAKSKHEAVE